MLEPKAQRKNCGKKEPEGLLCVCGPLNGKNHAWNGSKRDSFTVRDRDKDWLKHKYVYMRVTSQCASDGRNVVVQFFAYAGPE